MKSLERSAGRSRWLSHGAFWQGVLYWLAVINEELKVEDGIRACACSYILVDEWMDAGPVSYRLTTTASARQADARRA